MAVGKSGKILEIKGIFLAGLCVFSVGLNAQTEYCNKVKKKAKQYYEQAERYGFKGKESYFNLRKAIEEDDSFAEAYARLGEINQDKYNSQFHGPENKSAGNFENRMVEYFQLAMENCPEIENHRLSYILGEHFYNKKDYATAQAYLKDYVANRSGDKKNQLRDRAEAYIESIKRYFEILNNPVDFVPVKVSGASTENDEYLPSLSPDNKYLFFTRKQMIDTKSSFGKVEREIFTQSKNNYDGSFTGGLPMPEPFNMGQYQGGSSISVDNKLIFVTVVEQINVNGYGFANGDIYYTEFKEGYWSDLKSAGPNINSRKIWEGQPSISADNKTLYFSRAIDKVIPGEHYGRMDIYKSERQEDGSWGPAINLGPEINTIGDEKSPFIHSDSYTLYFASNNHVGMGGFDIFYSKMDKEEDFTRVKNLGYPINTEEDEHGFIVSTDGRFGYFSSLMEEESLDIYSFELYKEARPEKVVFVKGETISGKDALEGLEIKLKNVVTQKEVEAVLDKETGEYVGVIAVKEDEDVLMTAKKDGYAFTSQYISSNETVVGKPVSSNMEVKKIKKGETYKINNINFATNSYELNNTIKAILDEFGEFLIRNTNLVVELHGHTDNVGNANENLILSQNRAKAVQDYLVEVGVSNDRLSSKGFGSKKPVADNNTSEGRAENRRTEFLVISE